MIVLGRIAPPASSFIAAAHWPTTFSQTAISANHARTGTTCITRGALSWKPPWIVSEEEKDTPIGLAYDPAAVDRFFEKRPERVGARTAQTSSWTGRTTASTWRVRVRIREVGDRQRRLSSGMRLPEGPNVSVEFHGHRRLKELQDKLDEHFADLQKFTLKVDAQEILLEAGGVLLALAGDKISTLARKDTDMDIVSSGKVVPRRATAEKIRRAVTRLGPNFVKIGQALASRPDFVGEAIAGELLLLQDAMPPFSNKVAMELIRQELGARPEDCFERIGGEPVAAASLGQVYKAWIDEQPVAVKVQRPDLLEVVGLDFFLARRIAAGVVRLSRGRSFFGGRLAVRSDLVAAVDEYASRLFEELDYRKEAENMIRFRELYGSMPLVVVPRVLLKYSGQRVITSEWIDGEKLVNAQAQVSPADLPTLRVGIDCTLTQLLDKGFLHADPHGGNLLKMADEKLAYLDFGLVSTIPPGVMDALICATLHVMNRDYVSLAKGFPALALMSEGDLARDFTPFAEALEGALDPIVTDFRLQMGMDGGLGGEAPSGSERVAFAQIIDRVFLLARSFNFRVPPYFISNVRALGELEGLAMTADPGFNMISVVYPYVCRRLLSDPSPPLRATLTEFVTTGNGSVRWEVLETLMRDSNVLDERLPSGGETRTQPLDLSLQFLLSKEGAFVRAAAMSDLRRAAQSSLRSRLSWRWIFRERRRPSADGAVSANEGRREQTKNPMHHGDDKDEEVREASRRALQQRVLVAARRKPALAARATAMVVAAAGMALLRAFRRVLPSFLRGIGNKASRALFLRG